MEIEDLSFLVLDSEIFPGVAENPAGVLVAVSFTYGFLGIASRRNVSAWYGGC